MEGLEAVESERFVTGEHIFDDDLRGGRELEEGLIFLVYHFSKVRGKREFRSYLSKENGDIV